MTISSDKRVALNKLSLTRRSIEAMKPREKPWVAWDDKLTGFGIRVQPSGVKSFFVNYRTGEGGRKALNRNVVIGRFGRMAPERARRVAQQVLGKVAAGGDPALERSEGRAIPLLKQAFEDYMASNPNRSASTDTKYRGDFGSHLGDWQLRPLDAITRQDVEALFNRLTGDLGWSAANRAISLLRAIYRRPCVDFEGLRNPVDLWLAGGGRYHRPKRRKISAPAEVLPCWKKGIEAAVGMASARDALWFGLYTGMRIDEVLSLRWERVDMAVLVFRVEETKTGEPLELPVTRQLAAILERRWAMREPLSGHLRDWVFPSPASGSGRIPHLSHLYPPISEAGGAKFWFHGMRNCFITVAEHDLLLPRSLSKRLVNHARSNDVTEGYAADWTAGQLREPAQRIADRIESLIAYLPRTAMQRRLALEGAVTATAAGEIEARAGLVGRTGVAHEALHPSGLVEVDGEMMSARVEHGTFVARGDTVEIIAVEFGEIVVRAPTPSPEREADDGR